VIHGRKRPTAASPALFGRPISRFPAEILEIRAAGPSPHYDLDFNMRSFVAIFLMAITFWQITSGSRIELATATLSVAAAWFVSLFIAE
jgi:hypothetical protein